MDILEFLSHDPAITFICAVATVAIAIAGMDAVVKMINGYPPVQEHCHACAELEHEEERDV
jgi:hypothetical protein